MSALDAVSALLLASGAFFFFAGTVGLLRFPDVYTRLHALSKVDNLGLGLVVLGLMVRADSWPVALELALIWGLALAAAATASYLVATSALGNGVRPWRAKGRR